MSRLDKEVLCGDEVVTAEFVQRRVRSVFERANVRLGGFTPFQIGIIGGERFVVDVPFGQKPDMRHISTIILMPPSRARVPVDVLIKQAIFDLVDYMYDGGGNGDE